MQIVKKISLFLIPFTLFLFIMGCKKDLSPVKEADISLKVESTGVTDVWLKLTISESNSEQGYLLERDGQQIAQGKVKGETLIIDEDLLPKHIYNYIAYLYDSNKGKASAPVSVTTLDTTSHNFTWEVDTLGAYGSHLKDVAIISENKVWVVGDLQVGITPNTELHGAAIWDGSQWNYKKIIVDGSNIRAQGIHAFVENDIWIAAGSIVHYNGTEFTLSYLRNISAGELVNKVWGLSTDSMYGIGKDGLIVHYDGNSWAYQNSEVNVDLHDITGNIDPVTGQTRIWIAGERTLLYSDGGENWQVVWDQNNPLLPDGFNYPAALYVPDNKRLVISATNQSVLGSYQFYQENLDIYKQLFTSVVPALSMGVNGLNDLIMVAGSYFKISHFNGFIR